MRLGHFDALEPQCPSCAINGRGAHPLVVAERIDMRAGVVWQGMIHCSNKSCWTEFPVIDGVPVIVPDVEQYISNAHTQILARPDLSSPLRGLIGDALGQGTPFDADRQHLSMYAHAHYDDWSGAGEDADMPRIMARALALSGAEIAGAALDIGCSVGRGAFEFAPSHDLALGVDLNFAMLRLAQALLVEGRVVLESRRIGLVYDPVEIVLPAEAEAERVDFWAADAITLPFTADRFATVGAINLVDCIAAPVNMLHEAARVTSPGGRAFFTTPYDWAETVTDKSIWFGGHSQRGPWQGRGEDVMLGTLAEAGFEILAEDRAVPWHLRIHARSLMRYEMHMVGCRRSIT